MARNDGDDRKRYTSPIDIYQSEGMELRVQILPHCSAMPDRFCDVSVIANH